MKLAKHQPLSNEARFELALRWVDHHRRLFVGDVRKDEDHGSKNINSAVYAFPAEEVVAAGIDHFLDLGNRIDATFGERNRGEFQRPPHHGFRNERADIAAPSHQAARFPKKVLAPVDNPD